MSEEVKQYDACPCCETIACLYPSVIGKRLCVPCLDRHLAEARVCARRALRLAHHERMMQARGQGRLLPGELVEEGEWGEIKKAHPWAALPGPIYLHELEGE